MAEKFGESSVIPRLSCSLLLLEKTTWKRLKIHTGLNIEFKVFNDLSRQTVLLFFIFFNVLSGCS